MSAAGRESQRRSILGGALAEGGFTERELAAPVPDTVRGGGYGSFVEYRLDYTLSNLKRDGLVENPSRGVWRLSGAAAEKPESAVVQVVRAERLEALRALSEREYLRTPEWRRTRAAALVRAGHRCSLDRSHTDGLEVHHNTYERVGAELASDLVVLCRSCHRLHHQANGRPRRPTTAAAATAARAASSIAPPSSQMSRGSTARHAEPRSLLQRLLGAG